jgi:hypothetical protein
MDNPARPLPTPSVVAKGNALVQWLQTATGIIVAITSLVAAVIGLFALFKNMIPHTSDSSIVGTWKWANYPGDLVYRFTLADDGKRIVGVETGMIPPSQTVGPIHLVGSRNGNNIDLELVPVPNSGPVPPPSGYHLVMSSDGKTLTGVIYPQPPPLPEVILVKVMSEKP